MDETEMRELVKRKLAELGEHCDCAIILVTWQDKGQTLYVTDSCGNGFAHDALLDTYVSEQGTTDEDEFSDEWVSDD